MSNTSPSPQFESEPQRLPSWKQEINDRLTAHRTRRTRSSGNQPNLPLDLDEAAEQESKAARVAARVAARYAKAPSFEDMLAAARAAEAAAQAAQEAQQAAHQAHQAAQAMLAGFDEPEVIPQEPVRDDPERAPEPVAEEVAPAYSIRPEPRIPIAPPPEKRAPRPPADVSVDAFEDAFVLPAQPLPAKLLEFPRELIATRKARPRLEEGPLREEATIDTQPERSQLRIFEADSVAEEAQKARTDAILPIWSSIRLDANPATERAHGQRAGSGSSQHPDSPLQPAPFEDRLMAGIVDVALVLVAFLLFVLVFVACTAHPPTGKAAFTGAAIALAAFFVLYQLLFFSFAEGTLGMRYAHIALCTFDDNNPDRKAMRSRVLALLLSALPLGLGFIWAFFDEDRLSWHDRISRTYQRSYRA